MPLLKRVVRIYPEEDEPVLDAYDRVRLLVNHAVREWSGAAALEGWPNGVWQHNGFGVSCSEWRAEDPPHHRLLHLDVEQKAAKHTLSLSLRVGYNVEESILVAENWHAGRERVMLSLDEIPTPFDFLRDHRCRDEDGFEPGRLYTVSEARVPALVDFLTGSSRRLPLLLLSPPDDGSDRGIPVSPAFLDAIYATGHVMRLVDSIAAATLRALLPHHACYNGAVRLYRPGFRPTDRATMHPYQTAYALRSRSREVVEQDFFAQFAEHSLRIFDRVYELDQLEREQDWAIQAQKAKYREQQLRLKDEASENEQLVQLLDEDRAAKDARIAELEADIIRLRAELSRVRWTNNSLLSSREQGEEQDAAPTLLLSAEARKQLRGFDPAEQDYWSKNIFPKLLSAKKRERQSERVTGMLGAAWVYPRSRSADGRRVIYDMQEQCVCVYELFRAAEHDSGYSRMRIDGINPAAYTDLQPWVAAAPERL